MRDPRPEPAETTLPTRLSPPWLDPRRGDIEDDASSTRQHSLLAIAGSLLAEISLPKLIVAWTLLIGLPALLLGLAPLAASAWLASLSRQVAGPLNEIWPLLVVAALAAVAWIGGRPLWRGAETAFWSLNSLAVQPGYALCREGLQHVAERMTGHLDPERHARLRSATAAGAGLIGCAAALGLVLLAWPFSRWVGNLADLGWPQRLVVPSLANAAVLTGSYLAAASLAWGFADATMSQPRDLVAFDAPPRDGSRTWRVAHLSDIHVVGERYGFRIECGRAGPRGNGRYARLLARLDAIHDREPLDLVLITGDMTDAGRSAEWAELLGSLADYPELAERTLILPGNHDINIVDRANPARLDLPTSPGLRLRQMRTLSAILAVQGDRVRIVEPGTGTLGAPLAMALAPHRPAMAAFANAGGLRLTFELARVWADAFPMVLPPDGEDGLGVIVLNSTADTHFSFTNALGVITAEQAHAIDAVARQFPFAHWIVGLHHHLIEYPKPVKAFSERIGTALINGSWFVRRLERRLGHRAVVMHGHRHIDWIGACGSLRIVSAPSPVMDATDDEPTCCYIHTLAAGPEGRLYLLEPERVVIKGQDPAGLKWA